MLNIKLIAMAAGFVGLFGLVGCQQQTSNNNVTVNVSSKATVSAYASGGSVSTTDYAYSDAQPDNVNLDLVMTLEDAARFESRIGIGAPLKRVNRYVGKTRREAIKLVVSELENYQNDFLWPDWVNNVTPISFFERAKKRNRFYCGESMFEDSLRMELSKKLLVLTFHKYLVNLSLTYFALYIY